MANELYQLLGLTPKAAPKLIKMAYRQLVKTHHPDAGGDSEQFQNLTLAYRTLIDPERRKQYDKTGDTDAPNINQEWTEASQVVMSVWTQLLEEEVDVGEHDMVEQVMANLRNGQKQVMDNLDTLVRKAARYKQTIARLGAKKKKENLLGPMLARHSLLFDKQIKESRRRLSVLTTAMQFMEDYTYSQNQRTRNPSSMSFNQSFTSTTFGG